MRLVSFMHQKGGVGKTTCAMSLAAVWARSGSSVLLADVDPQGSSGFWADQVGDELPFDIANETDPGALQGLRSLDYDVIVVDTPGSLEAEAVLATVLSASDFVIIPSEPAALAIPPLVRTVRGLVEPSGVPYRVLLNKVAQVADAHDAATLLDEAGLSRLRAFVRRYKVHETAPASGALVTSYAQDRYSRNAANDFERVALELTTLWSNTERRSA